MNKRAKQDLGALLDPAFYRALCDPSRIAIMTWLMAQRAPQNVSDVASGSGCGIDLSVVSRHLAILRGAGILESARQGKQVLYRVRTEWLVSTLRRLADAIEICCPATTFSETARPTERIRL